MKYKSNLVRARQRTLTEQVLKNLGFKKFRTRNVKEVVWRVKIPYYYRYIQVKLGNYPSSNPNCGIVSLWNSEEKVASFTKKGKKKMIKLPEREIGIAWYVNTPERLRNIIVSLTQQNIS